MKSLLITAVLVATATAGWMIYSRRRRAASNGDESLEPAPERNMKFAMG